MTEGLTTIGKRTFDYSTHDGKIQVGSGVASFDLRFSKASDHSIHFLRDGNLTHVARVKDAREDQILRLKDYDSTSWQYTIQNGEHFLARNRNGYVLGGKIVDIKDDTRGARNDEVTFLFRIGQVIDGDVYAP